MWNPLRWLKSGPSTAKSGTSAETDPRAQERKKRAKTAEELLQEYTRTYDALMARREELRMKIRGSQKRLGGGMHGNNHETIDRIQLDVAEKEIAEIDEILVKLGPDIETAREAQRVIMEDSAAQSKRSWDMLQHEVDREADRILLEEVIEEGLQKDLIKLADVESSVRESMEARSRYLEEMSHIRRPDATEKDVDILIYQQREFMRELREIIQKMKHRPDVEFPKDPVLYAIHALEGERKRHGIMYDEMRVRRQELLVAILRGDGRLALEALDTIFKRLDELKSVSKNPREASRRVEAYIAYIIDLRDLVYEAIMIAYPTVDKRKGGVASSGRLTFEAFYKIHECMKKVPSVIPASLDGERRFLENSILMWIVTSLEQRGTEIMGLSSRPPYTEMFKEAVARACSYSWAESSGANSATLHVAYMYFEKLIDADTDQRTLEQVISILDALRSRNGSLKKHKVGDFQIISQKFQQTLAYLKQSGAFPKTIAFSAVVESIKTETDRLSAQEAQRKELEQGYHAINKARTLLRMFRSEGMNIDRMKKEKAKYDVTMEAFRRKHAGGGQVGNVKQRQQVAELEKRIQDIFDQAVLRSGSKT